MTTHSERQSGLSIPLALAAKCEASAVGAIEADRDRLLGILTTARNELRAALKDSDQVLREYAEDAVEAIDAEMSRGTL